MVISVLKLANVKEKLFNPNTEVQKPSNDCNKYEARIKA